MGLNDGRSWPKISAVHADAKKAWYIGLTIAAGCLVAVVMVQFLASAPKFQGKTLERWVLQLAGRSVEDREEATKVIKGMGTNAEPELVRLLDKQDSIFRKLMWNWWQKVPARLKGKASRMQAPNTIEVHYGAAKALGLLGAEAGLAAPALGRAMRSKEPSVRLAAALALGQIGEAGLTELIGALSDKDLNIRYVAVNGLGEACNETNLATLALLRTVGDEERALSVPAGAGLNKLGTNVVPLLLHGMEQGEPGNRQRAIRVAAALRLPRQMIVPSLLKLAQDPDAGCRLEAIRALAGMNLPSPTIINALIAALKEPEPETRVAATIGLGQARFQAKAAVPALLGCLTNTSARVREEGARSLGRLGTAAQSAVPTMEALQQDPEAAVREAASEAVKKIRTAAVREGAGNEANKK